MIRTGKYIPWGSFQQALNLIPNDTLVLIDSCNSATAVKSDRSKGLTTLTNKFEVVAGAGFPAMTTGFTYQLIAALCTQGYNNDYFTVSALFENLMKNMLDKVHVWNQFKSDKKDLNGSTPVYINRTKNIDASSIQLRCPRPSLLPGVLLEIGGIERAAIDGRMERLAYEAYIKRLEACFQSVQSCCYIQPVYHAQGREIGHEWKCDSIP
jgi:hypothetical protein